MTAFLALQPNPQTAMMMANIFDNLPSDLSEEHFLDLFTRPGLRIERIVSQGHSSPQTGWYDQAEEEWVLVLKGSGHIKFADGRELTLDVGDFMHIPAHTLHKVSHPQPDGLTIWLAIFFEATKPN